MREGISHHKSCRVNCSVRTRSDAGARREIGAVTPLTYPVGQWEPEMPNASMRFEIGLESLKHIYATYLDNFWAALGFVLLAIGWFLTSGQARDFLARSSLARSIFTAATVVCGFGHVRIAHYFYQSSQAKMAILRQAMSPKYFDNYEITVVRLLVNLCIILLMVLVWKAKPEKKNEDARYQPLQLGREKARAFSRRLSG